MKTTMIALSAAALIVAAPAVFAQGVSSKTPGLHHKVSKKLPPGVYGYARWRKAQAKGLEKGYRGAYGYVPPSEPRNYTIENSRQAGGGGGGGGM